MKKIFWLITLLFSINIFAQTDSTNTVNKFEEIICYRYNFFQGDTLVYRVYAHDSIIIGMDKPLLRIREEHHQIVCDSVGKKNGYYYLNMKMIDYNAIESNNNMKNIERKSSPWLNRKVFFVMDSLGNRISSKVENENLFAMSPGGAFNPHLFFSINGYCKNAKESWISQSLDTLAENGNPYPLVERTLLFRAYEEKDTLGQICLNLTYISTGQGSVSLATEKENITVTSVLAGSGNMYISKKDLIPVYKFANIEQKLRIFTPEDEDGNPAWHFTSMEYFLEKFKPGKFRYETPKNNKKNKKRK